MENSFFLIFESYFIVFVLNIDQGFRISTIQNPTNPKILQILVCSPMRFLIVFFSLTIFSIPLLAQDASFEASTDARELVENEYAEVTFTLKNAQGNNFQPPNFKGFNVLSGPSRSNRMTIINGQRSQEMSFGYTIQPKQRGTYTIGPASIKVGGKTMKTKPISIKVVKAKKVAKGAANGQEVFVRVEVDTTDVYLGQQIMVNYKLFTSVDVDNYDILEETEYPGFFAHDVRRFNSSTLREVVDGVQYVTKVLKRVALFPQQTGLLNIDPISIRIGVVVGKRKRSSFFFNNQVRHVNVRTNEVAIKVRNLPTPQPDNFSGAVGNYDIAFNLGRNKITTDDAVSIKLAIRGDGDIKRLQPPSIAVPAEFELYEPKVLEEQSTERGGLLSGYKQIEYLMIPKRPGQYQIAPAFSYFNPDSAKYITLQPNVFDITITQGSGASTVAKTTPENLIQKDIRYIKTATSFSKKSAPFAISNFFYGMTALPFLFLAGAFIFKRQQEKNGNIDLSILKSRKAQQVAKQRLKIAEQHLSANKSRAFYDEISKSLLGYVGDKLNIPLSELSKDNVREKLASLKVTPSYICLLYTSPSPRDATLSRMPSSA